MVMRGVTVPRRTPRFELTEEQQAVLQRMRPTVVALDVGKVNDFATIGAMSVAQDIGDPFRPNIIMRSMSRAPHGTTHKTLAANVGAAVKHYSQYGPTIAVVDATGIGDGTAEMITEQVPVCFSVVIGGGRDVKPHDTIPWRFSVPKIELVDIVVRVVSDGRLDMSLIEPAMISEFQTELRGFQQLFTPRPDGSVSVTFGNDDSIAANDDLVLMTSVGLWGLDYAIRNCGLLGAEQ